MSSEKVCHSNVAGVLYRLTQSFVTVENMRRMFYKWLNAARTVRNRRVILQEKEQEMKRYLMASAWDKWRGAYKTEKLRPVVRIILSYIRSGGRV